LFNALEEKPKKGEEEEDEIKIKEKKED